MVGRPSLTDLARRLPAPVRKAFQETVQQSGYDLVRRADVARPNNVTSELDRLREGMTFLTSVTAEHSFPVTQLLFDRLSTTAIEALPAVLTEEENASILNGPPEHRMREALRIGNTRLPHLYNAETGLTRFTPPEDVHAMVRIDEYVGDQYYCDLVVGELERIGSAVSAGTRILDFGCSSGRVLATLTAAYPDSSFFGCDPIEGAIDWAASNIPTAEFTVSPTEPPLDYAGAFFDAVFAISIWSHYSESAARAWLAEMRRIIRPGGHLVFTTHGPGSLLHYLNHALIPESAVATATQSLQRDGFAFYDAFASESDFRIGGEYSDDGDWGVRSQDWGNSFIHPGYVAGHLLEGWLLCTYLPRRAEQNQDVYVFRRV